MRKMSAKKMKQMKSDFLEVAEEHYGLIDASRKAVGLTRHYYDQWIHNDSEFKAAVGELGAKSIKKVEAKLFKLIEEDNLTAVIFYLKTKAGYRETQYVKQETTFTKPIEINVVTPSEYIERTPETIQIDIEEQKKLNE
jgi:hypothetical protein